MVATEVRRSCGCLLQVGGSRPLTFHCCGRVHVICVSFRHHVVGAPLRHHPPPLVLASCRLLGERGVH